MACGTEKKHDLLNPIFHGGERDGVARVLTSCTNTEADLNSRGLYFTLFTLQEFGQLCLFRAAFVGRRCDMKVGHGTLLDDKHILSFAF